MQETIFIHLFKYLQSFAYLQNCRLFIDTRGIFVFEVSIFKSEYSFLIKM